jgi:coenzyme F420-reducing hydrogenase delta subunit
MRLVRITCAGRIDPQAVLSALENGAEKVVVLACHPESCQYLSGAGRAEKRVERLVRTLKRAGIDESRVVFQGISSVEPMRFAEIVG